MTLRQLVAASLVPLIATGIVVRRRRRGRPAVGDGAAPRRELRQLVHVQPRRPRRPDRGVRQARGVPPPLFRRQHRHERLLDAPSRSSRRHDVPPTRRHRGVLDAHAPGRRARGRPEPRADLRRRKTTRHVEAFPPGFRMIAGDAKATSAQPLRVTFWNCGVGGGVAPTSAVPTCPDRRRNALRLHVAFPSCWTGRTSTAPPIRPCRIPLVRGRCPARFGHAIPQISLI